MSKKIEIFKSSATRNEVLNYNGVALDEYCTYCVISESLYKDDFSVELDIRLPKGENLYEVVEVIENGVLTYKPLAIKNIIEDIRALLVNGSILKIKDEYDEYEIFRITNLEINNDQTTIYARQITLEDSLRLWIDDSRPVNLTGQASLDKLYTDSIGKVKELTTFSDIITSNTVYIVRKNFHDAITEGENCFLSRWGGEIERRGYKLSILNKRGSDKNVTFRRGKNYNGIEESIDLDELVTRIIPIAFDGITLPEKFIDSPKVNAYYNIFPREIKFEDIKYKESPNNSQKEGYDTLEEVYTEMRKRTKEYFLREKCDELKGIYNIKVVDISHTEEYKDLSIFERTWIGDYVNIIDEKLRINLKARVSVRKYDVIQARRIQTEVTNISSKTSTLTLESLKEQIDNIEIPTIDEIPNIGDILEQANQNAENIIRNGINNSHVVLKENEILIMDTKDVNTAVNVLRINKNGIAGSTTGYNGSYNLAMTIQGDIIANRITSGVMNANLIKAGVLMSANGKSWLNMENGTFNFSDKLRFEGDRLVIALENGKDLDQSVRETARSVAEQSVNGFRQEVAQTYPTNASVSKSFDDLDRNLQNNYASKTLLTQTADNINLSVAKKVGKEEIISSINQTAESVKIQASKIQLDGNVLLNGVMKMLPSSGTTNYASLYAERQGNGVNMIVQLGGSQQDGSFEVISGTRAKYFWVNYLGAHSSNYHHFHTDRPNVGYNVETVVDNGTYRPTVSNKGYLGRQEYYWNQSWISNMYANNLQLWDRLTVNGYCKINNNLEASGDINANYLGSMGNIACRGGISGGSLSISGSKNCIQETENFGRRLINAYETCDYYFGDIGESQTIGGECIIWIDDVFKEIISTEDEYQVFITKYGKGDIWVEMRERDFFLVKSENDIRFGWEIKGKRRGYEHHRLEEYEGDELCFEEIRSNSNKRN